MSFKQTIGLKSVQNARELGGYPAADGKRIKHGLLLRTGNLSEISAEDIRALKESFRLQDIIDFRMEAELPGADDPRIDGAAYHHLNVIETADFDSGDAGADFSALDAIEIIRLTLQSGMLNEKMYIGFLTGERGKRAYAEFFRILLGAQPDRAVLWHCTSGKDRTGLAAMLLLSALGAEEETVIDDYLLTNAYNAQRIAGTKQYLRAKGCDSDFCDRAVLVFDAVDERYMRTALAFLKQEYGSAAGYLCDELHLSQKDIELLKARYLE